MHHGRLSTIVIDCYTDDLVAATKFWSHAPGKSIAQADQGCDGKYAELQTAADEHIITSAEGGSRQSHSPEHRSR
ncbi:hypothetical protein [Dyella sp. S184]|uniref:hypothetical protein n=1 Tax=Dyella sp. S184 TaxID=1641862 RepID=UPI0031B72367